MAFIPHLLPVRRGMLVSIHLNVEGDSAVLEDPTGALIRTYRDQPFVRVMGDGFPSLRQVVGSNLATVRAIYDRRTGVLSTFCAIDNLLKGAAGQAVQHLNRLFGLVHTRGLEALARAMG